MDKINGFIRVGAVVPELKVGDIKFNIEELKKMMKEAEKKGIEITVFPELSITSSTLDDLFFNSSIIDNALDGLIELKKYTKKVKGIFIVGLPFRVLNNIYNVAAIIEDGHILGLVPKLADSRHFKDGTNLNKKITIDKEEVLMSSNILFARKDKEDILFGVEINDTTKTKEYTDNGATIIFNLASNPHLIGSKEHILNNIKYLTTNYHCAYIYTSSSLGESTTSYLYSPITYIVEASEVLAKDEELTFNSKLIFNDIDVYKLLNLRSIVKKCQESDAKYEIIYYNGIDTNNILIREYAELPFVPKDEQVLEEILNIQAFALAKRLKHINSKHAILGISGGLDSTLAFIVTVKAFEILNLDKKGIYGITLPGFGTSDRTYQNAIKLIKAFGATFEEISIKEACIQHFYDIDHDKDIHDVTYENTQARERTQILLDYANKVNGIVIGTGDLSELALGWCTYNGDHMSNYSVNASIPKTLVRHLVRYYADNVTDKLAQEVLLDILDTPVSPELLPPSESGKILQVTENVVGPYILHDFFIYHMLKYGASPKKLFFLAKHTFKDMTDTEIKKWLGVFVTRFLSQQFKRNCAPDGPSVGTISLSPHGGFILPSDVSIQLWKGEVEDL